MFGNNQNLKWLIPSAVVISILVFLAGYVVGKMETSEKLTLQDILTQIQALQPISSTQLTQLNKQLEEITTRIDKLSQNSAAIAGNSSEHSTPSTSAKLSKNEVETKKSTTTPTIGLVQQNSSNCQDPIKDWFAKIGQEAIGLTDYQKFPMIADYLFKGETNERIEAIKAIGRLASPELKQTLFNIVKDEEEELEVRLATIDSLDWKSDATVLIETFRTTDNQGIQDAILNTATSTDFTPDTEAALEHSFEEIFQGNLDESMKVSILEFFMEKNPAEVQTLLTLVPPDKFSPELRRHIERVQSLVKQKLQTQDVSKP